ncbi:ATP-binding protein [Flammeovirgaceae bacterium SG7u.111]|nr:ATP-binding protein [Flammeovirgaceae bacterium SG7u.132]WPO37753.1 ATP-binding protein [Flammeovirgaceae bacterium SG7u.111]
MHSLNSGKMLVSGVLLILSFVVMDFVISLKTREVTRGMAYELAYESAQSKGQLLSKDFELSLNITRQLRNIMIELREREKNDRSLMDSIMSKVLKNNQEVYGIWTVWEPNAFDGKDLEFARRAHSNGRFMPYWRRDGTLIKKYQCSEKETTELYAQAQVSRQEVFLNPHHHMVEEDTMLIICSLVPIIDQGDFLGVVGVYFELEDLKNRIEGIEVRDGGYASLVANNGVFVVHPEQGYIGKDINERYEADAVKKSIEKGQLFTHKVFSEYLGEEVYRVYVPVVMKDPNEPWSLIINIPDKAINASSRELSFYTLGIGMGTTLIIFFLLFYSVKGWGYELKRRQEVNARLSSVLESPTGVSIFSIDLSNQYLTFNKLHEKQIQEEYEITIFVGMDVQSFIKAPYDSLLKNGFAKAKEGSSYVVQRKYKRKYFEVIFNPIFDKDKEVIGITVFEIDITKSKTAEMELLTYRDQLEKLVEKRTEELNRQKDELHGQKERIKELLEDSNQKNEELNTTLSQLKSTQTKLLNSEKLASLGQLTAGIAHEINNPVNFISSNIYPLRRDFSDIKKLIEAVDRLPESEDKLALVNEIVSLNEELEVDFLIQEIDQMLDGLAEGARRTKDIVTGLRNFSRMDEGVWEIYDLQEGLDATLNLLNNKIKNEIEVVKNYSKLSHVECQPGKVNQVFMNLLSNAIQAMENSSQPKVLTIETKQEEEYVMISIGDEGNGMTEEVKKKIFEPFFTTKPVGEGTGLGLSISYGIIEQHGGRIDVESQVGEGTTFTVWLPVSREIGF